MGQPALPAGAVLASLGSAASAKAALRSIVGLLRGPSGPFSFSMPSRLADRPTATADTASGRWMIDAASG